MVQKAYKNNFFRVYAYAGAYFNKVFTIFLGRYQSKKIKQHFSTRLDKGYRLIYELSYLVRKNFKWYSGVLRVCAFNLVREGKQRRA